MTHGERATVRLGQILAPTDFSPGAELALRWASAFRSAFKANLTLLHVLDPTLLAFAAGPPSIAMGPLVDKVIHEERVRAADEMSKLATAFPGTQTLIREGFPRQSILKVAAEIMADLIVMGTHGWTGVSRILLGSVAEHIVRHSLVPVLTVHQDDAAGSGPGGGELRPTRILAPTDFLPGSDLALQWAQTLAEIFGAELIPFHALDVAFLPGRSRLSLVEDLMKLIRAKAEAEMSQLAPRVPGARPFIREGAPRQLILQVAAEMKADLIVMGTHGRTGLDHVLIGSVAEHVVRFSRIPVLTVRQAPPTHRPRVARPDLLRFLRLA